MIKRDLDVVEGEVAEVSRFGHMFKLNHMALASRNLRPWERHGPTQFWYTFEDFHTPLPAVGDIVTLHLRPDSTTIVSMEIKAKEQPVKRARRKKAEAA